MITKISIAIADFISFNNDINYPSEAMSEYVLSEIEKVGMLPPKIQFKMGDKEVVDYGWEIEDKSK